MSNLTPELLDELRVYEDEKESKRFSSFYDLVKGQSPVQESREAADGIFYTLSKGLKAMHVEVMENSISNCYPKKHMGMENPNLY